RAAHGALLHARRRRLAARRGLDRVSRLRPARAPVPARVRAGRGAGPPRRGAGSAVPLLPGRRVEGARPGLARRCDVDDARGPAHGDRGLRPLPGPGARRRARRRARRGARRRVRLLAGRGDGEPVGGAGRGAAGCTDPVVRPPPARPGSRSAGAVGRARARRDAGRGARRRVHAPGPCGRAGAPVARSRRGVPRRLVRRRPRAARGDAARRRGRPGLRVHRAPVLPLHERRAARAERLERRCGREPDRVGVGIGPWTGAPILRARRPAMRQQHRGASDREAPMALARVQPAAERRIPEWPSERGGGRGAAERTAESLSAELSRRIEGEVRFDEGSRALYAADLSVYRQVPIGVVIPRAIEDVIETVAVCREHGVPILGRGCGTSLAGQCCNVAVVIDFAKYLNRILELDPAGRAAWVEPGVICDQLRGAAERHHLTFAPDPATHEYCTLGGMIGNNSCGAHSVMGGKTSENIEELDILTYDGLRLRVGRTDDAAIERMIRAGGRTGEILGRLKGTRDRYADEIRRRFPSIPRRVSGYNLDELLPENGFHLARSLVGSESTCVLVLGAKVRLIPSPPGRALLVIGYPDLPAGADEVPRIMEYGPIALEAFDG